MNADNGVKIIVCAITGSYLSPLFIPVMVGFAYPEVVCIVIIVALIAIYLGRPCLPPSIRRA